MDTSAAFVERTDPYRGELLAHCYRMTGSIHDAEDIVQDTYVRAWRAFEKFEGRSSVRVWLYKIATNTCLTALDGRGRRPLPSGLGAPAEDHRTPLGPVDAAPWLEPAPDFALRGPGADPASVIASRAAVRLAFVAALQHLPARQRAVLILRDVLSLRAAEVADILETTTVAVNGALLRARSTLKDSGQSLDDLAEPDDPVVQRTLDAWVRAFEAGEIDDLIDLLRTDAALEMPPVATWFTGRDAVGEFFARRVLTEPNRWRLIETRANGQPAVGVYQRAAANPDGTYAGYGVQVLEADDGRISRIVMFTDPTLLAALGLPAELAAQPRPESAGE